VSKRPSAINNDPGFLYRPRLLRRLFTISAAVFMVAILWWIWKDFDRDWKEDQRKEMTWEARKLALEAMVLDIRVQDERARLQKKRKAAEAKIDAREQAIAAKEKEIQAAQGAAYAADMAFKEQKQYTGQADYRVHEAKTPEALAEWRRALREEKDREDRLRDAWQYANGQLEVLLAERKAMQKELDAVVAEQRKSAELKRLELVLASMEKKRSYNPAREIPLLDFLAPPTKVEQIVLDNLVDNYEFSTPKKVDRCGTCHMLAMKTGFDDRMWPVGGDLSAWEQGAYRFVYSVLDQLIPPAAPRSDPYYHEKELERRVDVHHQTLKFLYAGYDEETGEITLENNARAWRKYKKDGDRWVEAKDGHSFLAYYGGVITRMEGHWRTHPHFDDMVGGSSPHPYETFGCTTCHQGRGWSVDFGFAFHTPDRVQIDDWMTDERAHEEGYHLPLNARGSLDEAMARGNGTDDAFKIHTGWVPDEATEHEWEEDLDWSESKRHYWHWPQFPKMLVQSSCMKCHKEGLYRTAPPEYQDVRLGKPDPHVPKTYGWEDNSLAMNPALADAKNRVLIPKEEKHYRPENLERGLDNFLTFGCYGCHKLDPNVYPFMQTVRQRVGPPLDEVATKTTPEWARKWVRNPKDFRPWTRMPRFFGLTNNSHDFKYLFADKPDTVDGKAWANAEIYSIVAWIFDQSAGKARAWPEVDLSKGDPKRGQQIVVADATTTENHAKACIACHDLEIRDPDLTYSETSVESFADSRTGSKTGWSERMSRRQGPNLGGIGSKVSPGWLVAWLKNPRGYWHDTNMPDLRLTDQEALDVAAYLMTLKHEAFDAEPDVPQNQPVIDRIAGELRVGEQRESTQEALNAVARMKPRERTLYVGEKLFKHYGCFGCHEVEAYKNANPIGTELTEWGSKLIERLEFNHAPIRQTRFDFAYTKLINPRIYDYGMPRADRPFERLKMPRFVFTPREARDLATLLVSLVSDPVPDASLFHPDGRQSDIIRGRQIVRRYNCQGCHRIEEVGGDIWPVISKDKWRPPDLYGQGLKTNPQWLFRFLENPAFVALPGVPNSDRVRPWHSIRMPTFQLTDEEARALVRYFAALSDAPADFESTPPDSLEDQPYVEGKMLTLTDLKDRSRKYKFKANSRLEEARALFQEYQCKSCHSPEAPIDNQAPNFRHARSGRLRPQWMETWLWGPLKLQPGTAMPMFFPDASTPQDPQFFDGKPEEQIRALRDFVRYHYREEDR